MAKSKIKSEILTNIEKKILEKIDLSNAPTEAPEANLTKNEYLKSNSVINARYRSRKKMKMNKLAQKITNLSKRLQFLTEKNVRLKKQRWDLLDIEQFGNQASSFIPVESYSFQNAINSTPDRIAQEKNRLYGQRFRDKEKILKLERTAKAANLKLEILKLENENKLLEIQSNLYSVESDDEQQRSSEENFSLESDKKFIPASPSLNLHSRESSKDDFSTIPLHEEQHNLNEEQQFNSENSEETSMSYSAEELILSFPMFTPLPRVQTEESFQNGLTEKEEKTSPSLRAKTLEVSPNISTNEKHKKILKCYRARIKQKKENLVDRIEKLSKQVQFLTEENLELKNKSLNMLDATSFEIDTFNNFNSLDNSCNFLPISFIPLETGIQKSTEQMQTPTKPIRASSLKRKKTTEGSSLSDFQIKKEKKRICAQYHRDKEKKLLIEMNRKEAFLESEIQRLESENQQLKQQN